MFSNGDYWVEQRRFTLHTLRNLGVSRNIMERRILDEFHMRFDFCQTISSLNFLARIVVVFQEIFIHVEILLFIMQLFRFDNAKPDDAIFINEVFELLTANIINRILFSYGFDEVNRQILSLIKIVNLEKSRKILFAKEANGLSA